MYLQCLLLHLGRPRRQRRELTQGPLREQVVQLHHRAMEAVATEAAQPLL